MSSVQTRRRFLKVTAAASVLAVRRRPVQAASGQKPLLQIGLVADAQYADSDTKGTRFYRASIEKLGTAVEDFNRRGPAFCVHLGDLIDHTLGSFEEILKPLSQCRMTVHHLLGNHDFDVLDELKPKVPERLGMPARYSHFDHSGFRFVMLDTNDVSLYAHPAGSAEHRTADAELERLKKDKRRQAQPWNGGVGETQLAWFERVCREAGTGGLRVIVLAHHPVFPADVHNAWNAGQILDLIDRQPQVVAWLNGHNHAGHFGEHQGVPFVTMHGMVETADTTAYALASLYADRMVIEGVGREPSRELKFRS